MREEVRGWYGWTEWMVGHKHNTITTALNSTQQLYLKKFQNTHNGQIRHISISKLTVVCGGWCHGLCCVFHMNHISKCG
jgi:hypothetical protein